MKPILLAILGVLLGFLAGAFYNVGFDISQWSEGCRITILIIMAIGGVASGWLAAIK